MEHLKKQIKYRLWVDRDVIKFQCTYIPDELRIYPDYLDFYRVNGCTADIASCSYPALRVSEDGYVRIRLPGAARNRDLDIVSCPYTPKTFNTIKQALKQCCGSRRWEVEFRHRAKAGL